MRTLVRSALAKELPRSPLHPSSISPDIPAPFRFEKIPVTAASHILRIVWRMALATACVVAFFMYAAAQQRTSRASWLPDELYSVPGGFLGIASEGELARLTRYDRSLHQLAASSVFGLEPRDLLADTATVRRGAAVLLAEPVGQAALFRVPLDGSPEPQPLWRSANVQLDRIAAADDIDGDGREEFLLAGDSAVVVVRDDGTELFRFEGSVLAV